MGRDFIGQHAHVSSQVYADDFEQPAYAAAEGATAFWTYDFSVHGGAQGTIVLAGDPVPDKTFVNAAFVQVIEGLTSNGSAMVALGTGQASNDIKTAVAYNNAAYATGIHALLVHVLLSAQRQPTITISVADLTGGKLKMTLDNIDGWD